MNQPAKRNETQPANPKPVAQLVELPDRTDAVIKSLKRYRELQAALDAAMPDCVVMLTSKEGPKPFRKKAYWNAIALALGIDVELVDETAVEYAGADGKPVRGFQVLYRAKLPGREALGDGACTMDEPRIYCTYHNVRARAHTRGRNRAISNLVAFGEVSAEEADLGGDDHWPQQG